MENKLKVKESDIQRGVIDFLNRRKDIYFKRENSFAGKIIRKNGSSGYVKNNKPGYPDIVCCFRGTWCGLEIKSETGIQSPEQKLAEKQIINAGGHYYLIVGEKWLEQLNIIFS